MNIDPIVKTIVEQKLQMHEFSERIQLEQNHEAHHKAEFKQEVFTVYGNCGMCERTIEHSLKEMDGLTLAEQATYRTGFL